MTTTRGGVPEGAEAAGLELIASLLSTATAAANADPEQDLLASPASAAAWLHRAAARPSGTSLLGVELSQHDLTSLRGFREAVRAARRAGGGPGPASSFDAAIDLAWTPGGVRPSPRGNGWRRVVAVALTELMLADAAGVLPRLKTCAYVPCGYPFIDASRNQSRVWHDTARCGNVVNLRAARARRPAR